MDEFQLHQLPFTRRRFVRRVASVFNDVVINLAKAGADGRELGQRAGRKLFQHALQPLGDKLTRSTWQEILASDYIAQDLAPPGERSVMIDGAMHIRKMDVRLYTYSGSVLLAAARLYQGQTTNFRTEGGGFAPVYFI